MSLFDLTGKTAIITGSSRGIGKAIAEHYALHGANVIISSRTAEACEAVAASPLSLEPLAGAITSLGNWLK